jgi:cysteinyl-tRNA synthetase
MGLKDEKVGNGDQELSKELINLLVNLRQVAKSKNDWKTSDKIRQDLNQLGIIVKDRKDGPDWEMNPL